jgi:flagellar hook assembly protein FlgD
MLDKYIVLSGDSIEVQDDMESLEIGYLLDKSATEVNLTIKNENNETVCELHPEELSSGQHFITWDLKNTNGQDVAAGSYHLEVSAANGDETMKVQPLLKAQVNGVDGTSSDFSLITDIGDFNFNNVMRVLNS